MSNVLRDVWSNITLYCDYRRLDCRDLGPLARHGSIAGTDVRFSPLGAHFTGTGRIVHPDDARGRNTTGSVVVLCKPAVPSVDYGRLFSARDAGGTRLELFLRSSILLGLTNGAIDTQTTSAVSGAMCVAANYTSGTVPSYFVNGLPVASGATNLSFAADDAAITIGNLYTGTVGVNTSIACVLETNVQLTADQHSKLFGELSSLVYPQRPYEVVAPNSLVTSNRRGLVGRWDPGSTSAGVCSDTSDTGAHGTVTGTGNLWVEDGPLGKVARVEGAKSIDCGAFAAAKGVSALTISAWLKRTAVTTGGAGVGNYNNNLNRTGIGMFNADVLWQVANANAMTVSYPCNDTLWHHVVLRFDGTQVDNATRLRGWIDGQEKTLVYAGTVPATTHALAGNWTLVQQAGLLSLGSCGPVAVWSRALDPAEIVQEYRRARPAGFKSDWGVPVSSAQRGGVIGAELESTGWRHSDTTGRFWVDTSTISGTVVKTIRCSTAGALYLPTANLGQPSTDAAYGSWEFSFNKADASDFYVYTASPTIGATAGTTYIRINTTEPVSLAINGVGVLFTTAINYVVPGTWYRFRLTRTFAGVYVLYILGGVYAGWTVVGTATNNTYTTSTYMVLSLGVGDVVALGGTAGEFAISKTLTV